ncbi:TlpA family protein disulfide reductase [Thiocystis violascens]|uniref:Peroxiredoxin n=1 Tax=Thiocystis violascens (strain ATCC 17096 / DSM 198 / 6111) TaxID=765911 RepID=I3Y810_THIV6|nr:TlpA disulfide reductase family protein [Thiocystis violascens]AFL73128.1 Peroxiredoxin [Thiocystis violascens DSM 198]
MKPIKVIMVTFLAGGISIGAAIFGQRWVLESPLIEGLGKRPETDIQTLPDFRLPDLNGHLVASNAWAGKVLVLNYWASWCPPCVRELPLFIRLQNDLHESGVQFVGIAVDRVEDVKRFVADDPINYPLLIADADAVALAKRLGNRVEGLPFTVIFDRRGRRVFSRIGEVTANELEARLAALVEHGGRQSTRVD